MMEANITTIEDFNSGSALLAMNEVQRVLLFMLTKLDGFDSYADHCLKLILDGFDRVSDKTREVESLRVSLRLELRPWGFLYSIVPFYYIQPNIEEEVVYPIFSIDGESATTPDDLFHQRLQKFTEKKFSGQGSFPLR